MAPIKPTEPDAQFGPDTTSGAALAWFIEQAENFASESQRRYERDKAYLDRLLVERIRREAS